MYYSFPLHKGTLINYEDMRILKYRGEMKSVPFVLICGCNRAPLPLHPLAPQINILQINLERLRRDGRMEGRGGGDVGEECLRSELRWSVLFFFLSMCVYMQVCQWAVSCKTYRRTTDKHLYWRNVIVKKIGMKVRNRKKIMRGCLKKLKLIHN